MTTRTLILCSLILLPACDFDPKYIGDPSGGTVDSSSQASTTDADLTDPGGSTTSGADPGDEPGTTTTGAVPSTTGGESTSHGTDTSTTTSITTTGGESTSHGTTAGPDEPAPLTCELPSCPPVVLHCDDCPPPDEAACVWQALADNASVELITEAFVGEFGPNLTRSKWIPLGDAERHVLVQHETFKDGLGGEPLGPSLGLQAPQLCVLAPAALFAACPVSNGADCYEAAYWYSDCVPVDPVVCPLP